MKRTPLKRTQGLNRTGSVLERRIPLTRGNGAPERETGSVRGTGVRRARSISPASRPQRLKVQAEGKCRVCGIPDTIAAVDPAHVCDRSLGGCGQPDCTVPLCRPVCHPAYDEGRLDLLPFLTKTEQAHAVGHLGIVGALRRATNDRGAAA